ncbi:uncharacterized protein LOC129601538 [Paramacrobiotus metropolitanus]|uniref:uncharacterized protein LOC129601538 n=1 Tax=Paramacrobiotus metropolitanus TaxID=2943436 RepID=UPI002446010A|nr:uncharacterized protein LOC129601538 [Paramacrobiotus metropolitanus]
MYLKSGVLILLCAMAAHARPRPDEETVPVAVTDSAGNAVTETSTVIVQQTVVTEVTSAVPVEVTTLVPVEGDTTVSVVAEGVTASGAAVAGDSVTLGSGQVVVLNTASGIGGSGIGNVMIVQPTVAPATVGEWQKGASYNAGDIVVWDGQRYKALQQHNAYAYNWTPPQAASLWQLQNEEAAV